MPLNTASGDGGGGGWWSEGEEEGDDENHQEAENELQRGADFDIVHECVLAGIIRALGGVEKGDMKQSEAPNVTAKASEAG